jgi:hypothetical protein
MNGAIVARNMWTLININILKKVVHQVGFIYKISSKSQNEKYSHGHGGILQSIRQEDHRHFSLNAVG